MAHRTRLSRTERRTGARSFRGARLAGVSSSCVALHRRVCVLGRGAAGAFPPCAARLPPPGSPTQRFLPAGRSRCALNDTSRTPSPRCTGSSRGHWRAAARVSRVVVLEAVIISDTVVLGHHSIKLTVDTYGHLVPGANRAAVDRLDDATGRNLYATTEAARGDED